VQKGEILIIPDINLLIYAYDSTSPLHRKAGQWWVSCLTGSTPIGLPWVVALGFVRLWTNPRIFEDPMPMDVAAGHVESWLERRIVRVINPGPRHSELLFGYLRACGRGGNLTADAHLAALAVELNAEIHTTDTDFVRFSGVKWKNPLD
jgi:toxin-antitoxin system PIN domain toxin